MLSYTLTPKVDEEHEKLSEEELFEKVFKYCLKSKFRIQNYLKKLQKLLLKIC